MKEELLSIKEAAKLMDVCENTLRDWDIEGKFKAFRTPGNHRRYSLKQIRDYLEVNQPQEKPNLFPPEFNFDDIIKVWESGGFLDCVETKAEKRALAVLLDNCRLSHKCVTNPVLSSSQSIWLTQQGWLRSRFRKLVSVQPLSGPCGMVYYLNDKTDRLNLESCAVAAKTSKFGFSLFCNADFETIKHVYAEALGECIDSYILGLLPKVSFKDLENIADSDEIKANQIYDYIIVPKDRSEKFRESKTYEGVEIFETCISLDPITFELTAVSGRYPNSHISSFPIFCPYILCWEGMKTSPGVVGLMMRAGWLLEPAKDSD